MPKFSTLSAGRVERQLFAKLAKSTLKGDMSVFFFTASLAAPKWQKNKNLDASSTDHKT